MALASGLNSQLGFIVPESAYGTYTAPTAFVPLVSESLSLTIARMESKAIIAGARVQRSQQWAPGNATIAGNVAIEVDNVTIGKLLRAMFGAVVTSGAGPYLHTFTPGDLTDDFGTFQVGRPDVTGTVQPFSYLGCQVNTWEMAVAAGEIATLGIGLVGKSETTGSALAAATYTAGIKPMTFVGSAVTIAGVAVNTKKMTLRGDNGLDATRRFLGSALIAQPLEAGLRAYSGVIECEFESLTNYNRFVSGVETALVFTIGNGTQTLVTTMNVRYDGTTPSIQGSGITMLSLPFKVEGVSTDAGAITSVFTTTDVLP